MSDFYDSVQAILTQRHITKKELATKADIPYSSLISAFNRRSESFSTSYIRRIAEVLNVPLTDLIPVEQAEAVRMNAGFRGLIAILESAYSNVQVCWEYVTDSDGIPEYNGDYHVLLTTNDNIEVTLSKSEFEVLFGFVKQNIPAYIHMISSMRD